ncbi:hypothetical protein D9619_002350 [Psilocybe cf. subviscida]|uniref:MARVEL domain-containing protein n=1 Tax=Psilocybe cf. subviscida TaxID=2480587 RepID=A0A8H5AVV4_9AGAR|nr:hypothetical protein D9619_002350 [Psilocybe cf. subviscida]
MRNAPPTYHAIGTIILFVLSGIQVYLGAGLIHAHEFEFLTKSAFFLLVYTVFVSAWTMVCASLFIAVPIGAPKRVVGGIKSVSSHFCFLALLWALWLGSAAGILRALNEANCSVSESPTSVCRRPEVLDSTWLNAFHVFAWVIFSWINVLLISVFVFGLSRLRKERSFAAFSYPPPISVSGSNPTRFGSSSETSGHAGPSRLHSHSQGPNRYPDAGPSRYDPSLSRARAGRLRKKTSSLVALLPSTQHIEYGEESGSEVEVEAEVEAASQPSAA